MENKSIREIISVIFKAVTLAMGVAVVVTSILDGIDTKSALIMLGVGVGCIGAYLLKNKN